MMRDVEWSFDALADFKAAINYVSRESEGAAKLVANRLRQGIDGLADIPAGRQGRVAGTYEKVIQKTSYIVAYRVTSRTIFVVRIIHAARDWPEDEWPAE